MNHRFSAVCLLAALAFTPTGLASGVPDLLHPQVIQRVDFPVGQRPVPVAFSRDGSQVLSIDTSGLSLWNVASGRLVWRSPLPVNRGWYVRPDGVEWRDKEILLNATTNNVPLRVRVNASTGKILGQEKRTTPDLLRQVTAPAIPAAQVQARGNTLWQTGVQDPPFNVRLLATFSYRPDLSLLAFKRPDRDSQNRGEVGDQPVQVFDTRTGKVVHRFQTVLADMLFASGMSDELEQLKFSPNGQFLSWSAAGRVTVWDVRKGEKVAILRPRPFDTGFAGPQVRWAADNRSVTLSGGNWLQHYSVPDGQLLQSKEVREGFQVFSPAWDVATSDETSVRVETADGKKLRLGRAAGNLFFSGSDRSFISFTEEQTAWFYRSGQVEAQQFRLNRPMRVENALFNVAAGTVDLFGYVVTPPDPKGQQNTPPPLYAAERISIAAALKGSPSTLPLAVTLKELSRTEEPNKICAVQSPSGENSTPQAREGRSWPSPAATLRLCEAPYLISARKMGAGNTSLPLWSLAKLKGSGNADISQDDRHLLLTFPKREVGLYHANNASLVARLTVPGKGADLYVESFRVSPNERLLTLKLEGKWRFFDLRTKQEVTVSADIRQAQQVSFVEGGRTLAVQQDSAVVFYLLK